MKTLIAAALAASMATTAAADDMSTGEKVVATAITATGCGAVGAVIGAGVGWVAGIGAGVATGGTGFAASPFIAAAGAKGGALTGAAICGGITALAVNSDFNETEGN